MPIAPSGMALVHLADGSVTHANENAIAVAVTQYAKAHKSFNPNMKILGFENSCHGNSMLTLSVSDAKVNEHNVPTHDYP
jgi:adenosylmethionine-8-amino-7-oxononanoate aminotransferase